MIAGICESLLKTDGCCGILNKVKLVSGLYKINREKEWELKLRNIIYAAKVILE